MNFTARIISYILHPILLPLVSVFIVLNLESYVAYSLADEAKNIIYIITLLFTLVLPSANVLFLYKKGIIGSMQMHERKERILPLFLAIISYGMLYYFIHQLQLPFILDRMTLGALLTVAVIFIITVFWKISIHLAGIGCLMGALVCIGERMTIDLSVLVMLTAFFAGFIGFARLKLSAHSSLQVYGGFVAGVMCEVVSFFTF